MGVSFLTKDSFMAGTFFAPGMYRINKVRWTDRGNYGGDWKEGLFLRVDFQPIKKGKKDYEPVGEESDIKRQYFSAGKLDYFEPENDGCGLKATAHLEKLPSSSNAAVFLNSIINAGLKEKEIDPEDSKSLQGLVGQFASEPQPERKGFSMDSDEGQGGGKTLIVCKSVEEDPDADDDYPEGADGKSEDKGKKSASKKSSKKSDDEDEDEEPKSKKKSKKDEDEDEDDNDNKEEKEDEDSGDTAADLKKILKKVVCIEDNEDGIEMQKARMKVFKKAQDELDGKEAKAVVKAFNDKDELASVLKSLGWKIKGDMIRK